VTARILAWPGDGSEEAALAAASSALRAGEVVGIPTDTVYGLAVDPWRPGATARLFAVKDRPRHVVLPILVADEAQALSLADGVGPDARRLMAAWWPGPLTVVLARRPRLDVDLGGDATTVGLRCPDHAVPRALAASVGPVATTSANRHGRPPVTTAPELADELVGVAVVIDAGECRGQPSTVVDCTAGEVRILRDGSVSREEILATLPGRDGRPI
jgi:L-threonylcarbamoyladenylate synthase